MLKVKKIMVHGCFMDRGKPLQCKDCNQHGTCSVYDGVQIGIFSSIKSARTGKLPVSAYSLIHYYEDREKTVQYCNLMN